MPRVRKYKNKTESQWGKSGKKEMLLSRFSLKDFLLKIFAVAGAVALVLSYVSAYLEPSELSSVLMFFGLYFIPILFFNIIIFLIALFRLKSIAFLTLLAMLPTLFYADLFVKFSKEENAPEGEPFKVLTYNVGRMRLSKDGLEVAANSARIEDFLKLERPDIVCLQEFSLKNMDAYQSFAPALPFRHEYVFGNQYFYGNVILSKHPIVDCGTIKFEGSRNMCIWADIEVDGEILRVYNCHLQSSTISFTSLIQRIASKGELSSEIREVHEKLRTSNKLRAQQVEDILAHSRQCDYPTLICGDFNDTPVSHTYHKLRQGRKDSFAEAGKGFGATYSYLWPLLRIDYILFPKEFSAFQNEIKREQFSDHYPVSTFIYR